MKNIIIILGAIIILGTLYVFISRPTLAPTIEDSSLVIEGGDNVDTIQEESTDEQNIRIPSKFACVGEYCDGSMSDDDHENIFTVLQIPLVIDGGTIGCGADLFFAPHAIPKTVTPLDATYKLLFDLKAQPEIPEDGFRNIVAVYDRLFYDKVTLSNGNARVYLKGNLYGPGHCSLPELRAQISQAALQFESVESVEVYLNGTIYDWCEQDLSDGEGSCPEVPQLWVDSDEEYS